jgi:hypothetical protein
MRDRRFPTAIDIGMIAGAAVVIGFFLIDRFL